MGCGMGLSLLIRHDSRLIDWLTDGEGSPYPSCAVYVSVLYPNNPHCEGSPDPNLSIEKVSPLPWSTVVKLKPVVNVKERLPVVRAPEYECTITCRESSWMWKNNYLSLLQLSIVRATECEKKLLPIVRAPECERTFTCRKSSRIWMSNYLL
jgi:hypothetical protein